MDPLTCNDGTPYAPKKYREIVNECWYISDQLHTSYTDVLDISYQERMCLLKCIKEKQEATQKAIDDLKAQQSTKK